MLLAGCAAGAAAWTPTQCGPTNQRSQWFADVDPANPLPEYPRPQLVRAPSSWVNLNGLWQFQPGTGPDEPMPPTPLAGQILVPFPVESCLSGVGETHQWMWYYTSQRIGELADPAALTLHFGAVDWQADVWINGVYAGNHTGGYSAFSFPIPAPAPPLLSVMVRVYDPSDTGAQPNGKQRISAITKPGGDTYTPSSGIWQTVWVEATPTAHISDVAYHTPTLDAVHITVYADHAPPNLPVNLLIFPPGSTTPAVNTTVPANVPAVVPLPASFQPWAPGAPVLYKTVLTLSHSGDTVESYFGIRTYTTTTTTLPPVPATGPMPGVDLPGADLPGYPVDIPSPDPALCSAKCDANPACGAWAISTCEAQPRCWLKSRDPLAAIPNSCRTSGRAALPAVANATRPLLNGAPVFLAGWLDQSFWPDGLYTAPTDAALRSDVAAVLAYGLNAVRLHQKVNPQRWYYWADTLGVVVIQDAVQKYGGATAATVPLWKGDAVGMVAAVRAHPSVVQLTVFNEGDCYAVFDVKATVDFVRRQDKGQHLLDTDSGGGANDLRYADVYDVHTYPFPIVPLPSPGQYGMVGEFGGFGAFISGREWVEGGCYSYMRTVTTAEQVAAYTFMMEEFYRMRDRVAVSIYTQITDVEEECDGFLNYDRSPKLSPAQIAVVRQANLNVTTAVRCGARPDLAECRSRL